MTTHRIFPIEAAHAVADRLRTVRHFGRGWTRINDHDVQRELNAMHTMSQATPYRLF